MKSVSFSPFKKSAKIFPWRRFSLLLDTLSLVVAAGCGGDSGGGGGTTVSGCGTKTETIVPSIANGDYHSLALTTDGTLWAWGYNFYGQLGDGTTTNQSSPVQVGF